MPEPIAALQALRASTADLLLGVQAEAWDDDAVRAPSWCEGWTRGHVLTHVARNADGISATLAGALRGEIVARYPDGWDARNADIEAGSGRPVSELLADLRDSADRLDRVAGAVADADAWERPTDGGRHAAVWLGRRLVEVEVHHVDLRGAYTPDQWPPVLVADLLPDSMATLADRTSSAITVTVAETNSIVPELVGRTWSVGAGEPTVVEAPDWALLAWISGRGEAAGPALGAVPGLKAWR